MKARPKKRIKTNERRMTRMKVHTARQVHENLVNKGASRHGSMHHGNVGSILSPLNSPDWEFIVIFGVFLPSRHKNSTAVGPPSGMELLIVLLIVGNRRRCKRRRGRRCWETVNRERWSQGRDLADRRWRVTVREYQTNSWGRAGIVTS